MSLHRSSPLWVALWVILSAAAAALAADATQPAAEKERKAAVDPYPLPYPPVLPDGKVLVTDQSPDFLKAPSSLREGVAVAKAAPSIDFMYYPGQDHAGKPWSNWGEGCVAGGKYYSAIGDHLSPRGTALVCEYDPATKQMRVLADVRKVLEAAGEAGDKSNYTPGKVHSRIRMGSDGWLYYGTHRGSPRTTADEYGYRGDWILRTDPRTATTEVVAAGPVPKHAIPMSGLDPARMIFYGGTAPGQNAAEQGVRFFAYDVRGHKVLLTAPDGPERCAIFAASTGRVYWDGKRYDPATNAITECAAVPMVRSSTNETTNGIVYGTSERSADVWAFDTKTETLTALGPGAVARAEYTTSMAADATGRYLYYVPGAHGRASEDGTPVVQFDTTTKARKVIAFLSPFYANTYGYTPDGTFGLALDEKGETLYVTWNGMRKGQPKFWECAAMTAIHIPAGERAQ